MTRQPTDPFESDKAFGAFLRRHDLVTPPSAETLAVIENCIMAEVAAKPRSAAPAGLGWLPGMMQSWASSHMVSRSAGLLAILILALGFLIGRDFGTLSAENTDSAALYASTGSTPWQSFLITASAGDTDDATDDSGE